MINACDNLTCRASVAHPPLAIPLATSIVLTVALSGCSTLSSLGLPVSSGPHKLLASASEIRDAAGHPEHVPHESSKAVQEPHRVEPGDVLVVEANDYDSPIRFPSDQTVQADGTIDLGEYGRVRVAGRTIEEIQRQTVQRVSERLSQPNAVKLASTAANEPPRVRPDSISVRLVSNESSVVYVLGDVNAPGSYPLVGRETVLDLLIAAGGLTDRANKHKIMLTRPATAGQPREILPVCYQQIVQLGDTSTNFQLQPGDRIFVPSMNLLEDLRLSLRRSEGSCPHCTEYGS